MSGTLTCPNCAAPLETPATLFARMRCAVCQGEFVLQASQTQAPMVPLRRTVAPEVAPANEFAPTPDPVELPRRSAGSRRARPFQRRRPAQGGWLQHVIGIAGGGFLGIAAGYYLLNYFGGPQFDFLHLPLPMVAHTQRAAPRSPATPAQSAAASRQPDPPSVDSPPPREPASEVATDEAAEPDERAADVPDVLPAAHLAVDESGEWASANDGQPPASEAAPSPPPANPQNTPRYKADDLSRALDAIRMDADCRYCESTGYITRIVNTGFREYRGQRIQQTAEKHYPCRYCRGRSADIDQPRYVRLCHLAEVVTFVDLAPDDAEFAARRQSIETAFRAVCGSRAHADSIGRLAGHWLDADARDDEGVLLAGTVRNIERSGPYHLSHLVLFGLPKVVTVASLAPPPYQPHDRILIAGSIIEHPSRNLEGYQGNQPVVVWGGFPLQLPATWR